MNPRLWARERAFSVINNQRSLGETFFLFPLDEVAGALAGVLLRAAVLLLGALLFIFIAFLSEGTVF